jgi:hypothetical protein
MAARRCGTRLWMAGVAFVLATGMARAQAPCTDLQAQQWPGSLTPDNAEQADGDRRYHGKADPAVQHKIDQAALLLKQAVPDLKGVSGKYYHELYDPGPNTERYRLTALFLDYYCEHPNRSDASGTGGKLRIGDETGTWIYITFNTLGWLVNERVSLGKEMRTAEGQAIFELPPDKGEWNGYRVLSPALHGDLSAAIVLTPPGLFPFKPVSREQFLRAREAVAQKYLDAARAAGGANSPGAKFRETELTDLQNYRASMSPAELQSQAVVQEWSSAPRFGRIFTKDPLRGRRLVTVDRTYIDKSLPKSAVQLIVLYWRWEEESPAKREFGREFRRNFDVAALARLLDR